MIKLIKNRIRFRFIKKEWRKLNCHNFTQIGNIFDLKKVIVGRGTYGCLHVYSWRDNSEKLIIGDYCSIASNVKFILGGEHNFKRISTYPFNFYFLGERKPARTKGPIVIENDVWIGLASTILSGVRIGQGAIIGAESVVAKDIPPYAVAIGNPCKIIKYRFSEEVIKRLCRLNIFSKIDSLYYKKNRSLFDEELTEDILNKLEKE